MENLTFKSLQESLISVLEFYDDRYGQAELMRNVRAAKDTEELYSIDQDIEMWLSFSDEYEEKNY